jgi:hypothetical protein
MPKYADSHFKLVARVWSDPSFKAQLLADPTATLTAAGVPVPPGVRVKVVENTDDTRHFVLPARPADADILSEKDLEKVAAGEPTVGQMCQSIE